MKIIKLLLFCLTLSILPGCGEEERFIPEGTEIGDIGEIIVEESGAVDLGLTVKWAACDLGAQRPYVSGDIVKGSLYWSSLKENQNVSGTKNDPATIVLGEPWRLPTKQEFEELIADCKWSHAQYHNVDGWYITGPSGKTIFMKDDTRWSGTFLYGYHRDNMFVLINTPYIKKIDEYTISSECIIRPVCD